MQMKLIGGIGDSITRHIALSMTYVEVINGNLMWTINKQCVIICYLYFV